ncbi:hypothetical protein [uncultured Roseovarius sp.]|uniref:hypothetical protein n=1 Tax=uncultured Roseovarius sp. TaxID=293344 RepID=UPI0026163345|nr:hypothetical protein [uncultured Roseovarius sp.]
MKRMLLVLVGIAIGLVLVVLSEGRMSHLRMLTPGLVPDGAAGVDGRSTVWRGQLHGLQPAVLPVSAELDWRFGGVETQGVRWDVELSGAGLDGQAVLGLPLAHDRFEIRAARAEVLLDEWPSLIDGWPLGGLLLAEAGSADIGLPERELHSVSIVLDWSAARVAGVTIGRGEAVVTSDRAGAWRAPFSLIGDVIRATGTVHGRLGDPRAQLEMQLETVSDSLPEEWLRALDQIGRARDGGWTITREIDLSQKWPLF